MEMGAHQFVQLKLVGIVLTLQLIVRVIAMNIVVIYSIMERRVVYRNLSLPVMMAI